MSVAVTLINTSLCSRKVMPIKDTATVKEDGVFNYYDNKHSAMLFLTNDLRETIGITNMGSGLRLSDIFSHLFVFILQLVVQFDLSKISYLNTLSIILNTNYIQLFMWKNVDYFKVTVYNIMII